MTNSVSVVTKCFQRCRRYVRENEQLSYLKRAAHRRNRRVNKELLNKELAGDENIIYDSRHTSARDYILTKVVIPSYDRLNMTDIERKGLNNGTPKLHASILR